MASNPVRLLAIALKKRGITITSAAKVIGLSQPSLSRILSGQQRPGEQTRGAIEREWGVSAALWPRPRAGLTEAALERAGARRPARRRTPAPQVAA